MVALELQPLNRAQTLVLDEIKVVSTHSRKTKDPTSMVQTQNLINTSDILYVEPNKKRTDNWLISNRLQLPLDINKYGPIKSITYPNRIVNTKNNVAHDFDESQASSGVATMERPETVPEKKTRRTVRSETRKATEDRLFNKRELERLSKISAELENADELTVEQVTKLWGEMRKLHRNVYAMSAAQKTSVSKSLHWLIYIIYSFLRPSKKQPQLLSGAVNLPHLKDVRSLPFAHQ